MALLHASCFVVSHDDNVRLAQSLSPIHLSKTQFSYLANYVVNMTVFTQKFRSQQVC